MLNNSINNKKLIDKKLNDNFKKILCYNMLNEKKCNYGEKCMYAHYLNEQKIEPIRHKIYTLIKCSEDLSRFDLVNDIKLLESILQLTKVCIQCSKNLCPGGYNCRNGAINIKYKICYDDLMYGNCKRLNCQVHLTDRKLVPYNKQKLKLAGVNIDKEIKHATPSANDKNIFIKTGFKKKINTPWFGEGWTKFIKDDEKNDTKLKRELNDIKGILLTEKFIFSNFGKQYIELSSSETDKDEDVETVIKYLNDYENDSENESIFLV